MNEPYAKTDEYDDGGNLEQDHHVIRFSRFANPAHKNNSEQHDDQKRRPIEAEMPSGRIKFIAGKIAHAAREVRGGNPSRVRTRAEPADNRHQHERYGNRGSRARPSERRRPVNQIFKQGSVQDGRNLQLLSSDGGPDDGENSGTDDSANTEGGEAQPPERLFQSAFRLIRIGDQLEIGRASCRE